MLKELLAPIIAYVSINAPSKGRYVQAHLDMDEHLEQMRENLATGNYLDAMVEANHVFDCSQEALALAVAVPGIARNLKHTIDSAIYKSSVAYSVIQSLEPFVDTHHVLTQNPSQEHLKRILVGYENAKRRIPDGAENIPALYGGDQKFRPLQSIMLAYARGDLTKKETLRRLDKGKQHAKRIFLSLTNHA